MQKQALEYSSACSGPKKLIVVLRMLDGACHKRVGVLLKYMQAGLGAKVNSFSLVDCAWEIPRIL
jgi:hypothetical protein